MSQKSKEARLASHIFDLGHDDPWGCADGLNGFGTAIPALGQLARE
jgi:hypothetical protein